MILLSNALAEAYLHMLLQESVSLICDKHDVTGYKVLPHDSHIESHSCSANMFSSVLFDERYSAYQFQQLSAVE